MRSVPLIKAVVFSFSIAYGYGIEVVEERIIEAQLKQEPVDEREEFLDLDRTDEIKPNSNVTTASEKAASGVGDVAASSEPPMQSGPFIDLFGPILLSLEYTGQTTAKLKEQFTNEALRGKKVVGVYFSADWCGPCRQFTPELVKFYEKINSRRGKQDQFQVVWVSRCRDVQSYGQYFTEMPWIALPPQEAMGQRGELLSKLYNVKGIPTLVLLDDFGGVMNKEGRNMIPKDKAGVGFPWRNPIASLYACLVPRSLRLLIRRELGKLKTQIVGRIKSILGRRK